MRDSNIINNNFNSEPEIITIDEVPEYSHVDYDIMDEKDFKKYIKDIEKAVRNSIEYRHMISYLRENMDMNACAIYENVNNMNTFKIKIHLHHHPFSLWDICIIVYKKRLAYDEDLSVEAVAKEVMHLHYNMLVGLIPLSETVHELVHNKYIFIPLDRVFGKWEDFYNMYFNFMEEEYKDLINDNIKRTKEYNDSQEELSILNKKYIYLNTENAYNTPDFNTVIQNMNNRIQTLDNENQQRFQPNYNEKKRVLIYDDDEPSNSIF